MGKSIVDRVRSLANFKTVMPEHLTDCDEHELLSVATAGSSEALGLLLFRHRPRLVAIIRNRLGGKLQRTNNTDDILQESYRRAFTGFHSANFEDKNGTSSDAFAGWLTKITINCIRELSRNAGTLKRGGEFRQVNGASDQFRDQAKDLITEISTGDPTVSQFAARAEATEALRVAITSLSTDQQQAIRLRYFDQCSIEQVAESMNRTAGSVRGLLDRARAALRVSMHNSALWLSKKE